MTREEVLQLLRKECEQEGSQVNFARKHKLSPAYVHDVLTQRTHALGPKILAALGLERVDNYRRIRK